MWHIHKMPHYSAFKRNRIWMNLKNIMDKADTKTAYYMISFMKCPERQISSCLVFPWKHALTSHGCEGNFWVIENVLKLDCCCEMTYLLRIGNLYIHSGWIYGRYCKLLLYYHRRVKGARVRKKGNQFCLCNWGREGQ